MKIIKYGNDIGSYDTKVKDYYNSETQKFDVEKIFNKWDEAKQDPSRKIARDVCILIRKYMFE